MKRLCRPLASHSRLASQIICSQHSLLWLLRFVKTSHCDVFTRSPLPVPSLLRTQISNSNKKRKQTQGLLSFFWRRRRDLNSRAGYVRPTPLAGAPLRPLEYFSKYPRELPLPFRSRPIIIYDFSRFVKGFWAKILFI